MSDGTSEQIQMRLAESPDDYATFTSLVREYIDSLDFVVDFQDLALEIAESQRRYGKLGRGAAILVTTPAGTVIGIAGLRDLGNQVCELKRMYVQPLYRNAGIGKRLCEEAFSTARSLGYHTIRLDTLDRMAAAKRLYESLGFRPISPYTTNPLPDAQFYELHLDD